MRLHGFVFNLFLCLAAAIFAGPLAHAQTSDQWPQRPVRFIIPLGPGSGVDITARLLADKLAAKWGQPVVVENRPGGDAFLAITAVLNARDDHVLLFAPASTWLHSIISSALASISRGTVRPRRAADFRLTTNSNLSGSCTGRSAGFAPLRILST